MDKLKTLTDTFEKLQPTGESYNLIIPQRKGDIPPKNEVLAVELSVNGNTIELPVTLAALMEALDLYKEDRETVFINAKETLEEIDSSISVD